LPIGVQAHRNQRRLGRGTPKAKRGNKTAEQQLSVAERRSQQVNQGQSHIELAALNTNL
jgi:hypothetical protein